MKKNSNLIEASSLRRTTINLAAVDWRDKVNQDRRLRADWRNEKLSFIDDYIGSEATRSCTYDSSSNFVRVSGGGEQASSQIQSGRQGSRGRPKKQGNKNQ